MEAQETIDQSANGFEVWNYNKQEIKEQLRITDVEGVTLLLITDSKNVIKNKNINKLAKVSRMWKIGQIIIS